MQPTHNPVRDGADLTTPAVGGPVDPTSRRLDGRPETDADRRRFDLRAAGYHGPVDPDGHPVMPDGPVSVASTLRAAARYLSVHGWCQGCYYDPAATSFTPAACMVGAIGIVCYGGPVDAPAQQFDHPGFADFEAAVAWLDRYLDGRYGDGQTPYTAYDFNDAKGRTAAEVIAELLAAADTWQQPSVAHVDYPHEPGHLYDCPACEATCHCTPTSTQCVHCALQGHTDTWLLPAHAIAARLGLDQDGAA
jgi:hypothetical protein